MTSIRDHMGIHARALELREARTEVLASNIANAATPGYKARDFDFAAAMSDAMGSGQMRTSNTRHISTAAPSETNMGYRVPIEHSLDGNTVELPVEQMQFSENTVRYQTSLELLNRKITGLMSAIRGE